MKKTIDEQIHWVISETRQIMDKYPDSFYFKTGGKNGETDYLIICANYGAENEIIKHSTHFSIEELNTLNSIPEKQKKLMLLQGEKEKIEKQIHELIENVLKD